MLLLMQLCVRHWDENTYPIIYYRDSGRYSFVYLYMYVVDIYL